MGLVQARFPDAPGGLARFDWPVNAEQAQAAQPDFIRHRLALFGPYQDALWTGQPFLYHARLSTAMNLKLLDPRAPIAAAVEALERGEAPLASVEKTIRRYASARP